MTTPSYSFRRAEEASNSTGPVVPTGYTRTDTPAPTTYTTPTQTPTPPSATTYVGGIPVSVPAPTPTYTSDYAAASQAAAAAVTAAARQKGIEAESIAAANTAAANAASAAVAMETASGKGQSAAEKAAADKAAADKAAADKAAADKAASEKVLARDTFKNTLALFFGKDEVEKPWVNALYNVTSKYYISGSTIDESINLSVQDARNNPELKTFADRFGGIYALQDRLVKGEAIQVPTVAEYFKSESAMGDVLRQAGMADLANQKFLGDVLGRGKSVLEVTNLINSTFAAIDTAPAALKTDLQSLLSLGVSRTDIAKALLTGTEGAQALNTKIAGISTLSAAKSQGVTIDMATAADLAAGGADYGKSLAGFADVKRLERGQALGKMSGIDFTQSEAIGAQFQSNVKAQDKIAKIVEGEGARFAGKSGRLQSQNRTSGLI